MLNTRTYTGTPNMYGIIRYTKHIILILYRRFFCFFLNCMFFYIIVLLLYCIIY